MTPADKAILEFEEKLKELDETLEILPKPVELFIRETVDSVCKPLVLGIIDDDIGCKTVASIIHLKLVIALLKRERANANKNS